MIFIARVCVPIIAAVTAYLGIVALVLLSVGFSALSLRNSFHWFLFLAIITTAVFALYAAFGYFFGGGPRRQFQVLLAAFAFLLLAMLVESPAGHGFIR